MTDQEEFLRAKLREAYEAWASSEMPLDPIAEYASEAYAHKVIKDMLKPIQEAIQDGQVEGEPKW